MVEKFKCETIRQLFYFQYPSIMDMEEIFFFILMFPLPSRSADCCARVNQALKCRKLALGTLGLLAL